MGTRDPPALASPEHHSPQQQQQQQPHQSASPRDSGAETDSVPLQEDRGAQKLQERLSSSTTPKEMAATKAELLLSALQISDPLSCFPPPLSPLDGYSKLEELQMLLQNAAAGGSLLAASAAEGAGLLSGDPGEYGGEERDSGGGWGWVCFTACLERCQP